MGGSAGGSMGHMSNMGSLAGCNVSDSKPMQFPLTQRRKRRVLFTQAQVSKNIYQLIPSNKKIYLNPKYAGSVYAMIFISMLFL